MKIFFPQSVSAQRLEGCQILEKENCSQLAAHAFSCQFLQKYVFIPGGSSVNARMPHITAYRFCQRISNKNDVNEFLLMDTEKKFYA